MIFFEYALYSPTSRMVHYVQVRTTQRAALHECARRASNRSTAANKRKRSMHERAQALGPRGGRQC